MITPLLFAFLLQCVHILSRHNTGRERHHRDTEERGRSVESVVNQYMSTVRPMHHLFVRPTIRYADIIIPNDNKHDVAVDFLVAKIKDILNSND